MPPHIARQMGAPDAFVQLVGVAHPGPTKAAQFRSIDLRSAKESVAAASSSGVRHFVYVSVAHPAPIMHEYIAARTEGEDAIRAAGLNATILRPWYVLGPGRRWPLLLLPGYWLMGALPSTRDIGSTAGPGHACSNGSDDGQRQIDRPRAGVRVVEVPQQIRSTTGLDSGLRLELHRFQQCPQRDPRPAREFRVPAPWRSWSQDPRRPPRRWSSC